MPNDVVTNDDIVKALREFQGSAHVQDHMWFDEWRVTGGLQRDTDAINKAKANFGNAGHFSPGFGLMGSPGNTTSRAPTGPRNRPFGEQATGRGASYEPSFGATRKPGGDKEPWFGSTKQQYGVPSGASMDQNQSKYNFARPDQPAPWIDDVNMASVWYSPMEPVWPFGPPYYNMPREWNYPVGYNLNYVQPRLELMGMLRGMRSSWGVLATVIETRKDQLLRLPWTIQRKDKPRGASKGVDELRKFFRRPDGKLSYNQWARKILDDLLVIDAPTLYIDRNLAGKPRNVEVLDGGTIFPLIDDAGRRPDTVYDIGPDGIEYLRRQPAFQQIIYGLPMINLSEDEIIYAMMHPRADMPMFGYSGVEQIMTEATEAIRKTFYQLEFWRAGSMPELLITVPDGWTPRQIAMFQGHFDALLSGQLSLKSKARFVPGGMKPFDIKNASGQSLWSDRDELLVRLCCYAFSVSPTPFVKQMNRGTAQNASQSAQEEGLYPLMSWWKDDIMDTLIQDKFGMEDIEFVFLPRTEVDLLKQAQIHKTKIDAGEMTRDEARAENGEEPYPDGIGQVPTVTVGAGVFRLDQAAAGEIALPGAAAQDKPENGSKPGAQSKPSNMPQRGGAVSNNTTTTAMPKPTPVHKMLQDVLTEAFAKGYITHQDVKDAARDAHRDPSKGQKATGNYRKGHIYLQGLNISIENAKGSKRGEKDRRGNKWQVKMPAAYGYIRGTIGADGEQMDVYIGKHPESTTVYVIDQDKVDQDGIPKGFDEHKCMLGYNSSSKAIKDYLKSHFDGFGHERACSVTEVSMKDFKTWLKDGDLKSPFAEQNIGTPVARRNTDGLDKADTVSAASGLSWYNLGPKKRRKRKSQESVQ